MRFLPRFRLVRGVLFGVLFLGGSVFAAEGDFPARTVTRLEKDKKLTIGYLGGSLTDGTGASDKEKTSWRAQTTAWFRERFPQAEIVEVNAALGGTGSDLGVYRMGADLLGARPDLVFVEFAVNDSARGKGEPETLLRTMEGIVRQILRANPKAEIVFVYTTMKSNAEFHERGELPPAVIWHQKVADHYGIPSVNIGLPLWEKVKEGGGDWSRLLPDNVHPNDEGYAVYGETMRKFLDGWDWTKPVEGEGSLPAPLVPNSLEHAKFVDVSTISSPGWKMEDRKVGRWPHCLTNDKPGTELTYTFHGTGIGAFWLCAPDSGDVEFSIDDKPVRRRTSWSKYGAGPGRGYGVMFADPLTRGALEPGEHKLVLRIAADHNPESTGNWIRIAGFLINESPSPTP